jgi:beta-N-acetylhexosaminidase
MIHSLIKMRRAIVKNCSVRYFFLPLLALFSLQTEAQITDSLDFKIGQMIMIGIPEAKVDSAVLREVKSGMAGAIIFFEKNVPGTNSYAGLKKIAWTYQQAAPVPLLIGIDQEGGKVNRLKEKYGFPRSITAAAMGKDHTLDSVRFYAASTAANLAGLGININFAPVVDVAVNPDNPVIVKYGRSFSPNEDSVIIMAEEYIKQHRKVGVITVLKHFPGHGSSKTDTHFGIADVTHTWSERELRPYQVLLDSGYVDAIMTAHIVNNRLDNKSYPGTLSEKVIDSLLRKKLGYQGVVFSDDMQMNAIAKLYGLGDAIKLSINAGVDILCFSNNIQGSDVRTVDKVHSIIHDFVAKGEIKKERIDEAYHRIRRLKSRLGENTDRRDLLKSEAEVNRLKKEIEDLKKASLTDDVEPKSAKKKKKK